MDSRRQTRVLIAHRHALVAAGLVAALADRSEIVVVNLTSDGVAMPIGPGHDWPLAEVAICDYESATDALAPSRTVLRKPPPVLVVSHIDGEGDVRRALDAGVQGYLLLDSTAQELVDAVIEVCNGSRYISPQVAKRVVDSILASSLTHRELEVAARRGLVPGPRSTVSHLVAQASSST